MKHLREHIGHYLVHTLILGIGLVLVFLNKQTTDLALIYVFMTAMLYFTWSLVHHHINHQLHPRLVYEYVLIVTLGVVLSFFLFQA